MKEFKLVFDCETTNTPRDETGNLDVSSAQVYDLGCSVIDDEGKVYEEKSFINTDVFYNKDLMSNAYFYDKIPQYRKEIASGVHNLVNSWQLWREVKRLIDEYHITTIIAHNSRFDIAALNATIRYQTKSVKRYFFKYGIEVKDSMWLAHRTICKTEDYKKFCMENNYMTNHKKPQVRKSAEVLWRYFTKDNTFEESHTGLADVRIEREIFLRCLRME